MISECEIVIETSIGPFERCDGKVGLIFLAPGKEERPLFGTVKNSTCNQAILYGIKNALPYCKNFNVIHLQTTNGYTKLGFDNLSNWQENGWKTAKGKDVKNADLWQDIAAELEGKEMIIHLNEVNGYRRWLKAECQRRAKK